MNRIVTIIFVGLLLGAAISDLRTRRIPNALTLPGLLLGLVLATFPAGITLPAALLGAGAALIFSLPLFALGALGGGDGKLLMMVGAFLGPREFGTALLLTIFAGGLLALHVTIKLGRLGETLRNLGALILYFATFGRRGHRHTLSMPEAVAIPYGLAIAAGSIVAWFGA
jgi:prepilin peptidase CpaA